MSTVATRLQNVKPGMIIQHPEFGKVEVVRVGAARAPGYIVIQGKGNCNYSGHKTATIGVYPKEQA